MPGFSGTGPLGRGPLTGRGRGYCMGYVAPGAASGFWYGRGGGGRRYCYYATGLPGWARTMPGAAVTGALYAPPAGGADELAFLKEQAGYLEGALEQAKKRIQELEKKE